MIEGNIRHDCVTRFLSGREYTSEDLSLQVKSTVCQIEKKDSVLIVDDTTQNKICTDEDEVMNCHYDHYFDAQYAGLIYAMRRITAAKY